MLDAGIGKFFTDEGGKMQQAQKPLLEPSNQSLAG